MLGYLIVRSSGDSLVAFLTNDGVLSNHHALFAPVARHPWSLLAFVTRLARTTPPTRTDAAQ